MYSLFRDISYSFEFRSIVCFSVSSFVFSAFFEQNLEYEMLAIAATIINSIISCFLFAFFTSMFLFICYNPLYFLLFFSFILSLIPLNILSSYVLFLSIYASFPSIQKRHNLQASFLRNHAF